MPKRNFLSLAEIKDLIETNQKSYEAALRHERQHMEKMLVDEMKKVKEEIKLLFKDLKGDELASLRIDTLHAAETAVRGEAVTRAKAMECMGKRIDVVNGRIDVILATTSASRLPSPAWTVDQVAELARLRAILEDVTGETTKK